MVKTGRLGADNCLRKERHYTFALAFATDGTKFVTCDRDQIICLRDFASGKELSTIHAEQNDPQNDKAAFWFANVFAYDNFAVAFTPDLTLAAIADKGLSTIHLWDLATGKEFKRFKRGGRGAIGLVFSPDGRTLLETTGSAKFYLWEVASGEQRRAVPNPSFGVSGAISPDNRFIALGQGSFTPKITALGIAINIYDAAADRFLVALTGHEGPIRSLSFSPDGRFLASGSRDMTGLVWDVAAVAGTGLPVGLTANERAVCWADLAGTAKEAYTSIWKLAGDKETVNFLRENLQPSAPSTDAKEVQKLVVSLSSEQVAVRLQATKELAKLGLAAEGELRKAISPGLTLETQRRLEKLLSSIANDQLRAIRAIEVLESINTPPARQLLETLSKGRADAWQIYAGSQKCLRWSGNDQENFRSREVMNGKPLMRWTASINVGWHARGTPKGVLVSARM